MIISISVFLLFALAANVFPQKLNVYQSGLTGQENLNAIANISPTSVGGMGFDTRYEGIKGSKMLFDTLLSSYMLIRGQDKYIQFNSDIDVVKNTLHFRHPGTGKLMEIPSDIVSELIVSKNGKDMVFITSKGMQFDKEIKENKFCQLLLKEPRRFIKITDKIFIEADYKAAYSADRRYDEYQPDYKYYIEDNKGIFRHVQLKKKDLLKMFPDKKELINNEFREINAENNEEKVIAILEKL